MSVRCHILTLLHLASSRTLRIDYWPGNDSKRLLNVSRRYPRSASGSQTRMTPASRLAHA